MKTVFKVGMKVYDQIVFPDQEGEVTNINICNNSPIEVSVENLEKKFFYGQDGTFLENLMPTLSTKPYKLEGFSQKPTFNEALEWLRNEYLGESITYKIEHEKYFVDYYYSKNAPYKSFEALRKLTILRDYYNNGCKQEDLNNIINAIVIERIDDEYQIVVRKNFNTRHVLFFKSNEIAEKFLEEQRELLEIAKPLL
nr:MAG TPA: hypothetical protein [Caudoviricetes sp.]